MRGLILVLPKNALKLNSEEVLTKQEEDAEAEAFNLFFECYKQKEEAALRKEY